MPHVMALNQEEGCLTRMEFDSGFVGEGWFNDEMDDFGDFCGWNCGEGEFFDDKDEKAHEDSNDSADWLPEDPFDMGDQLFGELSFVYSGTMTIHQDVGFRKVDENSKLFRVDFGEGSDGGRALMEGQMKEIMGFSYEKYWIFRKNNDQGGMNDRGGMDEGDPSDALLLALGYLGLEDLLVVEKVCKSLRDTVRGDPLLWRNIHIDGPFSAKITDDILIKLTNRAQGHLQSLCLSCCSKITDVGLKHVLERNPSLKKLSVPGCVRLTVDGILSNLKLFKSAGKAKLKYLGIYGVLGVTNQHFEEFKLLVGVDSSKVPTTRKPRFFGGGQLCANSDDDRAIDIEVCPICQQLRLVYDCPSASCQKTQSASQLCRACTVCIKRCSECGCCVDNCEYEELFSFDLVCLDCWGKKHYFPKTAVLHKQASYHFYLCG